MNLNLYGCRDCLYYFGQKSEKKPGRVESYCILDDKRKIRIPELKECPRGYEFVSEWADISCAS